MTESYDYDFAVIGGGSAGFNAARVASAHGLRTAIIDGAQELGGLCILRGCMPSKTLLWAADVLHRAQHAGALGLRIPTATADARAVQARKRRIIADFAAHRVQALAKGPFDLIRARARFTGPHELQLDPGGRLTARRVLIATGSAPSVPDIPGLAEAGAWTSDDVLDLDTIPRSIVVLGGGVVGVELGQYLARMGSRVTLIQRGKQLLGSHSPEAAGVLAAALEAEGMHVARATTLESVRRRGQGYEVIYRQGRRRKICRADRCLNALGRHPATAGLDLPAAGVRAEPGGQVRINRYQQTNRRHIYAAGDCSGPVEIVHLAVQQGELAARHAAGVQPLRPIDYHLLLNVVFTDPQVAAIGRQEAELRAARVPYLSASYPFDDHGKSILMEAKRGFVKVLAEPRSGRLLGAEIAGPDAGELIHLFSAPLTMRATVHDMLRAPWYHPTLAEIVTYPLEEIAEQLAARIRS